MSKPIQDPQTIFFGNKGPPKSSNVSAQIINHQPQGYPYPGPQNFTISRSADPGPQTAHVAQSNPASHAEIPHLSCQCSFSDENTSKTNIFWKQGTPKAKGSLWVAFGWPGVLPQTGLILEPISKNMSQNLMSFRVWEPLGVLKRTNRKWRMTGSSALRFSAPEARMTGVKQTPSNNLRHN